VITDNHVEIILVITGSSYLCPNMTTNITVNTKQCPKVVFGTMNKLKTFWTCWRSSGAMK
jgi:hypothetical protein